MTSIRGHPTRGAWPLIFVGGFAYTLWSSGRHMAALIVTPLVFIFGVMQLNRTVAPLPLVFTDRNLVLIEMSGSILLRPSHVIARLPRGTKIGPLADTYTPKTFGGIDVLILRSMAEEALAADALGASSQRRTYRQPRDEPA